MTRRRHLLLAAALCGSVATTLIGVASPASAEPTPPQQQTITFSVPALPTGEFGWSIDGVGAVLAQAVNAGGYLRSLGNLNPVTVTDTRPGAPGWSLAGQVANFSGGLSGKYLGWTPGVLSPGVGAVAGILVPPGLTNGRGLLDSAVLAQAPAGYARGAAVVGAALDVRVPVTVAPGTYTAVLTLTAMS